MKILLLVEVYSKCLPPSSIEGALPPPTRCYGEAGCEGLARNSRAVACARLEHHRGASSEAFWGGSISLWISGSADQWWMALPRRSRGQTRTTRGVNDRPRRAIGVSRVLACCVGTPVVSHRCFTLPRSSILCGCIHFPCRQVNAVWGRYPTACTMYITKKHGVCWGLVDKISPAFELRNSGVPCRSRQVIPAVVLCAAGACLSCTCGSSYPGPIYPLRTEFVSCPSPPCNGSWAGRGIVPFPLYRPQLGPFTFLRVLRCILLQPILKGLKCPGYIYTPFALCHGPILT
jgi:hypothetical protein